MKKTIFHYVKEDGPLWDQILADERIPLPVGLCGGRGVCGKCKIRFVQKAPLPTFADRKFFTPDQLRDGWRLACKVGVVDDCDIEIAVREEDEVKIDILTWTGDASAKQEPRTVPTDCFCAVDIGTTTVAMLLIDRDTKKTIATHTFFNPQRKFGMDVISRIHAAADQKAELLKSCIWEEVSKGLRCLEETAPFTEVILTGNMVMSHLFMGYPTESLGKAPFSPWHAGEIRFSIAGKDAYFLPGISAFIGADIVSGMYAFSLDQATETVLYLDLGTNGEMVLSAKGRLVCTATAAGSAFEEASRGKETGTDLVRVMAELLADHVMDSTGLLQEPWFSQGIEKRGVHITQEKIRNIQLAKAAIAAGIRILSQNADVHGDNREQERENTAFRVLLAGGFGYEISPKAAVNIGLLPEKQLAHCEAVGNGALAGAIKLGCSGKIGSPEWEREAARIKEICQKAETINLAMHPDFQQEYLNYLDFQCYD